MKPLVSIIVPSRGRVEHLRASLKSLADTTGLPGDIDLWLVTDDDDQGTLAVQSPFQTHTLTRPRPTADRLEHLYNVPARASAGKWVMIWSDDVRMLTRGWDDLVRTHDASKPRMLAMHSDTDAYTLPPAPGYYLLSRPAIDVLGWLLPRQFAWWQADKHAFEVFHGAALVTHVPIELHHEHVRDDEVSKTLQDASRHTTRPHDPRPDMHKLLFSFPWSEVKHGN